MALMIQRRQLASGARYFTVTVKVSPYPTTSKSFPSRKEALEWGRTNVGELKAHAERRELRADGPRLTLATLIAEFLDDPETQALKYHADLARLLAWWQARRGAKRVMTLNALSSVRIGKSCAAGANRPRSTATSRRCARAGTGAARQALCPPARPGLLV